MESYQKKTRDIFPSFEKQNPKQSLVIFGIIHLYKYIFNIPFLLRKSMQETLFIVIQQKKTQTKKPGIF